MDDLQILRVSVARIAQALGVAGVLQDANYHTLVEVAKNPRGWNDLAAQCVEKAVSLPVQETYVQETPEFDAWAVNKTTVMTENRAVTINLSSDEVTTIAEAVGSQALWVALGYLSTWNLSFPTCLIYREGKDADLVAVYQDNKGETRYVIGAVWNGSSYGFHS